jgi:hypothetical protein
MSTASRNSNRPPAMRNAPREIPRTAKMVVPRAAKAARVIPAAIAARRAVRRLCGGGSELVMERNMGMAAGGSTTRKRVVSVDREKEKIWPSTAP